MTELKGESDRVAVIVGAARLDTALEHLVRNALLPSPTSKDELLEPEAPLGTFSARINVAYRLGLIEAELGRALHLVRKMRNAFAHAAVGVSLSTEASRLREFLTPFRRKVGFAKEVSNTVGIKGIAGEFRWAIAMMVIQLDAAADATDRPSGRAPVLLIPSWWLEEPPVDSIGA